MKNITMGQKLLNTKYDFRETCFGIYEKDNTILLVKKDNEYSLIGGGIEGNETKEECLKREYLEESGYLITDIKPLCTIDCFWLAKDKWPIESLTNIYIVDIDLKKNKPLEPNHTPKFININKVMDFLPLPYHKKAIELYIKNKDNLSN